MIDFILAWRQAKAAIKIKKAKDAEYNRLVGEQLSYPIIKDLINAARHDVKFIVTLRDGTTIQMRREDAFDKLEKPNKTDLY
jgi:hypothetical protein